MDHLPVNDPAEASTLEGAVRALIDSSRETNRYIQALEQQLRRRTRALWGAITASALVVALALGMTYVVILDNRRQIEASQRKLCPMVLLTVPQPGDPPASTERGRLFAARATALAEAYGCL